jgi:uncharacterized membrane protein YgcG
MKRTAIILTVIIFTAAVLSCKTNQTHKESSLVTTTASPSSVKAIDYVTDNANVIDDSSRKQLETTLAALKSRKRIDFSVVTMKTTGTQSVRDYSLSLARERKSNSNEQNVSGLLLLVAVDDRNWHLQITRNLEDDLTDEILTNLSVPMTDSFRQNHYAEGIIKYVNALIPKLDQIDSSAAVN